ncbi:MAG TPA: PH domain-containing protein [Candidatus Saccharimonadia bacterium]
MNPQPPPLPFDLGITLDEGETVQRIVYRSLIDLLPTVSGSIALELFALGLGYAVSHFPDMVPFPPSIIVAMVGVTSVLAALILLIGFYVYRHNVLIFTNIHLVYVEQVGLFGRRVSQLNYRQVEDVTGRKAGLFQTILNYGDVTVQSAGEQEKFIFHNVSNPTQIADDALQQHEHWMQHLQEQGANPPME